MNGTLRVPNPPDQSNSGPKMRANRVAIAAVAACLMATAPAAAANDAVNGGFETPDIPTGSWAYFASIPGWTATNSCGIEVQDHVAGAPYLGNQFVELNSNCRSGIKQTLTLRTRETYRLSFAFSPRPGTQRDDNMLQVYWNGSLEQMIGPEAGASDASDTVWTRSCVRVTSRSTDSSNTLKFVSAGTNPSGGGVGVYLDHVVVQHIFVRMNQEYQSKANDINTC